VSVRRASPEDGPAIASLYTAARIAAVPQMPPALHTAEEDLSFFTRRLGDDEVTAWVAEAGPEVLGFALCTPTFLDGIYIRPDLKGQGIGSLLLDVVEATHPDGYELWVSVPAANGNGDDDEDEDEEEEPDDDEDEDEEEDDDEEEEWQVDPVRPKSAVSSR